MSDLVRDVEHDAAKRGIDLGDPPWSITVAVLVALADSGTMIDDIFDRE